MYAYQDLSDVDFEYLCQDIMQRRLGKTLHRFAAGPDGGVDLTDNVHTKSTVVQVKHYAGSTSAALFSALRKELPKVRAMAPRQYYVCCSLALSPQRTEQIYRLFGDWMDSPGNIVTRPELDDFLARPENEDILRRHYKLWLSSTGILEQITNGDVFVDCEVLLSGIEKEKRLFV